MAGEETAPWQVAAKAHLQAARKKQTRLGGKKTRTGCITCKIRRIKCDEAKPFCSRCTKTGRVCDGYSDISPRAKTPLGTVSLVSALDLKPDETRAYDYFLTTSGPNMAGSLDKEFWCGQLLQLCHSERFVLDAVLAISTLYQHPQYLQRFSVNLEGHQETSKLERLKAMQTGDPFGNHRVDQHHALALRYYNRSIATLKQRLAGGDVSPTLVLLSSMLYIAIEMVRDNVFVALGLFSQSISLVPKAIEHGRHDSLTAVLRIMLSRIAVIAATFGHTQALKMPPAFEDVGKVETFSSIKDARASLSAAMAGSYAFIKRIDHFHESIDYGPREDPSNGSQLHEDVVSYGRLITGADSEAEDFSQDRTQYEVYSDTGSATSLSLRTRSVMPRAYPPDWLVSMRQQEKYSINRLDKWRECFGEWQKRAGYDQSDVTSHLLLYYHVTRIWLATRLNVNQTGFDDFIHDFEQVLHHAEIYIQANAGSHFMFEVGVIPPLYLTAAKCRVPSLRRRALQLLRRAPQKESIWGAATTAQLVATLVDLEEQGLGLPSPCDDLDAAVPPELDRFLPSEDMRIHHLWILKNNDTLRFDVKVLRYVKDAAEGWQKVEQIVPIKPCNFGREGAFA